MLKFNNKVLKKSNLAKNLSPKKSPKEAFSDYSENDEFFEI